MQSPTLRCTQSVTGKKNEFFKKNIQNTDAEVVWSDESDARRGSEGPDVETRLAQL